MGWRAVLKASRTPDRSPWVSREQGWLDERQFTAPGNRNVIGVCQFQYGECLSSPVPGNNFHAQRSSLPQILQGSHGKQDGAGIVDAGVGVEEYSFWHVIPDVSL